MQKYMRAYAYACMHTCVCVCMHTCVYEHLEACTCVCIHAYICVYMHVCMYILQDPSPQYRKDSYAYGIYITPKSQSKCPFSWK